MIISGLKNDFVGINHDDSIDPVLGLSETILPSVLQATTLTAQPVFPIMSASNQRVCELPAYVCVCKHA